MRGEFKPAESQLTSGVNQSGFGGAGFTQSGVSQGGQGGLATGGGASYGTGQIGGGYGQGGSQVGGYQSGTMRGDYGSSSGQRGDFTQVGGAQIRGGQGYSSGASIQGGQGGQLGGQGIQGIQGATLTTSAIKPSMSETGMISPEGYKQFQSPSTTAVKLDQSKYERSYDIGSTSASRYNTPGTR